MIYSQVIFFCALFSLGYSGCPLKDVKAGPESHRDCKAWKEMGNNKNGIYLVKPDSGKTFQVYCDMETDGGGWTVFQRRMDGSIDFHRYWSDYKQGFGNLSGEFWLGLDKIHRLTTTNSRETHSLRVDLRDFANTYKYAQYSSFSIGDEGSKYTLSVGGYSGTAGDSLTRIHNRMKFTTRDQDNDQNPNGSCAAVKYGSGGWWYGNCHWCNLNGSYQSHRIDWSNWRTSYSINFSEMKTRRN